MVFQPGKLHLWSDWGALCTIGVGGQNLPRWLGLRDDWNQRGISPSADCPSSRELRAHSPRLLRGRGVRSCRRWTPNNWRSNPEDRHSWVLVRTSLTRSPWGRMTFKVSVRNARGLLLKFNWHWTRKALSFLVSEPSKTSGSRTLDPLPEPWFSRTDWANLWIASARLGSSGFERTSAGDVRRTSELNLVKIPGCDTGEPLGICNVAIFLFCTNTLYIIYHSSWTPTIPTVFWPIMLTSWYFFYSTTFHMMSYFNY